LVGKRLPTEDEYEFAATHGGKTRFPWGDDSAQIVPWQYGAVKIAAFDVTHAGSAPVYGLFSNVAEWTESVLPPVAPSSRTNEALGRYYEERRVIRGGPPAVAERAPTGNEADSDPRERFGVEPLAHKMGLGFRCARSAKPRFLD
jgi:formylglycine-generating enzyme required for sulfatase activity